MRLVSVGALGACVMGCSLPPPASQFPSGDAALERMHASYACVRGVSGDAKIDHFSDKGRVRGSLAMLADEPAAMRFAVTTSFGAALSTLTSDGRRFALSDLREKRFFRGPATPCNIARLTQVPVPGEALVQMFRGEAPVLVHSTSQINVRWSGKGYYVVEIDSKNDAREVVHLAVPKDDYGKDWKDQRVHVLDVRVFQQKTELYHAALSNHEPAKTAPPIVDDLGLEPPVPPSGPQCVADIPRKIHVEIPGTDDDLQFRYEKVELNPPLQPHVFELAIPGGVEVLDVNETCR